MVGRAAGLCIGFLAVTAVGGYYLPDAPLLVRYALIAAAGFAGAALGALLDMARRRPAGGVRPLVAWSPPDASRNDVDGEQA
jgi:hypothetical protein